MRRAVLLWAALAGACGGSPTTLTVTVDVPTGPPIMATYLDVTLPQLGDGGTVLVYDLRDMAIDASGTTLVVILAAPPPPEPVIVTVGARAVLGPPDGGVPAFASRGSGQASVVIANGDNTNVTVHLVPAPAAP